MSRTFYALSLRCSAGTPWTLPASQCRFGTQCRSSISKCCQLIIAARTLKHGVTELTGWVTKVHESEPWQIVCPGAEDVPVEMNGCIGVADYQREMIDNVAEH